MASAGSRPPNEGPNDSTHISPVELSANELASHVRMITCTKSSDPCNIDCTITPYGPDRPFDEVKILHVSFFFVP